MRVIGILGSLAQRAELGVLLHCLSSRKRAVGYRNSKASAAAPAIEHRKRGVGLGSRHHVMSAVFCCRTCSSADTAGCPGHLHIVRGRYRL
jgi:hypothetical protein